MFPNVIIRCAIHRKTQWIQRRDIRFQSQHSNIVGLFSHGDGHDKLTLLNRTQILINR